MVITLRYRVFCKNVTRNVGNYFDDDWLRERGQDSVCLILGAHWQHSPSVSCSASCEFSLQM